MKVTGAAPTIALLALLATAISACGGRSAGTVRPSSGGAGADEFSLSGGLTAINARAAHDSGFTGAGVTVAIIDTGVDTDHPELRDRIVGSFLVSDGDPDPVDPHGTFVAGLIAAERNDELIHGVAYDANILSIKASHEVAVSAGSGTASVSTSDSVFDQDDLAKGIRLAAGLDTAHPGVEADILNLSVGGPGATTTLVDALTDAVTAGKLIVAAGGNTDLADPQAPADLAADAAMNGQLIAVGSVGPDNVISSFSSAAGPARDFFLVAPGENIVSIGPGDVDEWTGEGTSFSAAFVSGAAAVLMDAFPHLTAAEVAEILFITAADLGDPGVDAVYGRGLVDLEAATQPIGTLSVATGPSVDGPSSSLTSSSLMLGSAFGDALSSIDLLGDAVAFDAFGRPYRVDLGGLVSRSDRALRLDRLVFGSAGRFVELAPWRGLAIGLSFDAGGAAGNDAVLDLFDDGEKPAQLESATMALALGGAGSLRLGTSLAPGAWFTVAPDGEDTAGDTAPFHDIDGARLPQLALVGAADGLAYSHAFDGDTQATVGWFTGAPSASGDGSRARLTQALLSRHLAGGLTLGFAFADVEEDETFLASRASGAFGAFRGARSRYATLLGRLALGANGAFFGSYTRARAWMASTADSLIVGWGRVEADAATAGYVHRGIFVDGDRGGLLASQPLRVISGEAIVMAPVGRDLDGRVIRQRDSVTLAPSGRETNLQFVYERPIAWRARVSGHLFLRREPGHDAAAQPDGGFAVKLSLPF